MQCKFNFQLFSILKSQLLFANILHFVAKCSDSVHNRKYGGVGIKSRDVCVSTYNFGSRVFGTMIYENLQVSMGSSINDGTSKLTISPILIKMGGRGGYVLNCLEYPPPSPSFMDIGQPLFYSTFLVQEQSFVHLAVLFHNAAKFFIKWSLSKDLAHGLPTPRERFFKIPNFWTLD